MNRDLKSRTQEAYWKAKVTKRELKQRDGSVTESADYYARILFNGSRRWVNLGTANKDKAAKKAVRFYENLIKGGWDLAETELLGAKKKKNSVTVGDYLQELEEIDTIKAETRYQYTLKFRTLVGEIKGIDGGKEKYDHTKGGRDKWLKMVNEIPLDEITSESIQRWKVKRLAAFRNNPKKLQSARRTVNSILRNSKSLFSAARVKRSKLKLPSPLWCEDLEFEKVKQPRYISRMPSVEDIISKAKTQLYVDGDEIKVECYKVLLLALGTGLRRAEMDRLKWEDLNAEKATIQVVSSELGETKSAESESEVDIPPSLVEFLLTQKESGDPEYILIGSYKGGSRSSGAKAYRCLKTFSAFTAWFRSNIVNVTHPIHELRKEFGSILAQKGDIYAASVQLRHSDIRITRNTYLDKKKTTVVDMPSLS